MLRATNDKRGDDDTGCKDYNGTGIHESLLPNVLRDPVYRPLPVSWSHARETKPPLFPMLAFPSSRPT
jgi:hypothetical protein